MIQYMKAINTCSSACLSGQALELIFRSWIHSMALAMLVLCSTFIHATVLSVALDGSQPYTSIQTAINASAHTDTVLVYPGRYYENVCFNGRNITLASLELVTGNRDYVYSTIIDANHNGTGIFVNDYETNITIQGFTVVNGTGYYNSQYDWTSGGGIAIGGMSGQRSARIINCHVTGNRADNGAGIVLSALNAYLSGVSIHHNSGGIGAGIYFAGSNDQYNTVFDPDNRCSIYSNYAANGSDLYYYNVNSVHVIVDTFTVANPWNFYASAVPQNPNISNPYIFDILNTVHQEVNHDLFVAPWGDDNHSGHSPAEPMRSIFMAMYRIASDSENPKTVHVANGHYSPSLNGQLFPIPVKSYTRLVGESRESTVLEAEFNSNIVFVSAHTEEFHIQELTLKNGVTGLSVPYAQDYLLRYIRISGLMDVRSSRGINTTNARGELLIVGVTIENISSPQIVGIYGGSISGNLVVRDVEMRDFVASERLMALEISPRGESEILVESCNIHDISNHSPDVSNTLFQISPYDSYGTRLRIEIKNSAFYDNYQAKYSQMANTRSLNDTLFISNCTFAGNSGGSSTIAVQGTSVLTNNIFHNPAMNTQIWIPNYISSGINSHTTLRYNNILGGASGVSNSTSVNPLIWGEGNTAYDPLFSYEGNRPYTLSPESPLIDSGWQAAFSEPGLDAGGNERLWDGDGDGLAIIDQGAYEYQPVYSPVNLSAELWNGQLVLSWDMTGIPRGLTGYRVYRNNNPHADIEGAQSTWFRERITQPDTLVYRVAALYGNVESTLSDSVVVIVTAVDNSDDLAPGLPTLSVGPNPFTDLAVIRYTLPRDAKVELKIYNLRGQLVRVLDSGIKTAGEQILAWEGCDDRAQPLTSGVYLLRLSVSGKPARQMKAVLVK